ncbi:uncharacterized protein DUF4383 [Thermosporothrix hazakensis]|jgi:predicted tellurium resistance membrane protein TerC|uniref:Uncharacterized protein DUF4383 n=1 Tax=Thermosporothrix hazakensis TaxID=644383 RepID=A0A326TQN4_THEHA|nr:DUF4383 domain-containing protein [Thermosporothrix hazakensis]PZW18209.1 uncharacterized protein DUF4383 [Thermosporothrix hazakensis]GCE50329.1 membrane protein [Thermosporothrix hazakensis]
MVSSQIQRTFAGVLGAVFLLIGVLGFIPFLTPQNHLLGIFSINLSHNIVHLLFGVLGLAAAFTGFSQLYNQGVGIIYLLIGILGFIPALAPDGMLIGLVHINLADNLLHIVIAAASLYVGFVLRASQKVQKQA